jgi:hypothetical protein
MNYMGLEYTIHHGPRGWAWKIYSDKAGPNPPMLLGLADAKDKATGEAKVAIERLLAADYNSALMPYTPSVSP